MTSSLVYIPLTPCVKKTLGCCNRLADDARAAGEFQERQYCDAYVLLAQVYENAKLLVCCADSLFGLDVRRRCVVLSSLQLPPHFFTQKSSLATSGIRKRQTACVLC